MTLYGRLIAACTAILWITLSPHIAADSKNTEHKANNTVDISGIYPAQAFYSNNPSPVNKDIFIVNGMNDDFFAIIECPHTQVPNILEVKLIDNNIVISAKNSQCLNSDLISLHRINSEKGYAWLLSNNM